MTSFWCEMHENARKSAMARILFFPREQVLMQNTHGQKHCDFFFRGKKITHAGAKHVVPRTFLTDKLWYKKLRACCLCGLLKTAEM